MVQTALPAEMAKTKILRAGNKWITPHKDSCAGFTLIELIVVILIIGISAAVVIVSAGRVYDKRAYNETSKRVFITLKHAREVALMERIPVTFRVDEDSNSYWLEKNGAIHGSKQNMPALIRIAGESIIFFPKGNSSGGSITIKDGKGREFFIEIDPVLGTPAVKGV